MALRRKGIVGARAVSFPARCEGLRAVGGWRLAAVLGDWRGKTLYDDIAWVSPDGATAVTASSWSGGAWGDAMVGWSVIDLSTGEERARGEANVSQDELEVLWIPDEGDALYGLDEGDRCFRVDLRSGNVMTAYARPPSLRPAAWQEEMRAARAEPLRWLGRSPDGRFALAAGTARGERHALVRVELRSGRCMWWHQGHAASVAGLAFSGDGARLASVSLDDTARVWDLADGRCAWCFELDALAPAWAVRFEGDGRTLRAWHEGGEVLRWGLDDGVERARTVLSQRFASHGSFTADGDLLATVDRGGVVAWVWDLRGAPPTRAKVEVPWLSRVIAAAPSGDGATVTILGHDGARTHLVRAAVQLRARAPTVRLPPDGASSVTEVGASREGFLSDDGARALVLTEAGLHWIDGDTRATRATLTAFTDRAASAYALTGDRFARGDESGVSLWDDDGRALLRLDFKDLADVPTSLAIAPDGARLAVGTGLGVVLVFDRA